MCQHIVSTESLPWSPLDFPGVFMRVVYQDARTGGMTVMTRLGPGASIPAHVHTQADETVFVLSGDFVEGGTAHGVGSYFVAALECRMGRIQAGRDAWCSPRFPGHWIFNWYEAGLVGMKAVSPLRSATAVQIRNGRMMVT